MLQKNRLLSLLFISVLFVVVILLISSCKKTATTPSSPATQKDIAAADARVQSFITLYNIPGASLAITKKENNFLSEAPFVHLSLRLNWYLK